MCVDVMQQLCEPSEWDIVSSAVKLLDVHSSSAVTMLDLIVAFGGDAEPINTLLQEN